MATEVPQPEPMTIKELGERSFDLMQRSFMNLRANPAFKNTLVGAFNEGSRGEVQISSNEKGINSSVWFDYGDYKYSVLYMTSEVIRDGKVIKVEIFSFSKYEKTSFDPNNVEESPNVFFDLVSKYEQHGDEKSYVEGSIIVGKNKESEFSIDSEEAFQKIPELFGEIFPRPLDL